jgi:DNA polymerase I-like protein with 3'-5' exonuclease and polymerase domains
MEIYLSTPQSIAERNHISVATATEWDKNHKETYKGYYAWANEAGRIARNRGYMISNTGRWRFTDEANSKGSGESPERNAVNFAVQGQ